MDGVRWDCCLGSVRKSYRENKGLGTLFEIDNVEGFSHPQSVRIAKLPNGSALVMLDGWLAVEINLAWGDSLWKLFALEWWGERIKRMCSLAKGALYMIWWLFCTFQGAFFWYQCGTTYRFHLNIGWQRMYWAKITMQGIKKVGWIYLQSTPWFIKSISSYKALHRIQNTFKNINFEKTVSVLN